MDSDTERRLLRAAERVAFYEDVMILATKRLTIAKSEYRKLGGDPEVTSKAIEKAMVQLAPGVYTESAYVTVDDLAEISRANGWWHHRKQVMKRSGFVEAQPYLFGFRTRVWVRGRVRAKDIQNLTQYVIHTRGDGTSTLNIRGSRSAVPKLPY